jgi:hypothetical protein
MAKSEQSKANHRAINRAYMARYRKSGKARQVQIKCLFGLNAEDYDALVKKQDNKCAICRQPETAMLRGKVKALALDHNHETNRVRGLLCSRCNVALGLLDDNVERVLQAALYLEQWTQ